jgi:hypothetical protein
MGFVVPAKQQQNKAPIISISKPCETTQIQEFKNGLKRQRNPKP